MKFQLTRGVCLSFFLLMFAVGASFAEEPALQSQHPVAPNLEELVRFVVIESSVEPYFNDKYWNKTSGRFDGFRIRGLRISKRKKEVRHGFCRKYSASLVNPEKHFQFEIKETTLPNFDGQAYLIETKLRARCEGTFAHYVYGVKGINGTTIADADVRVRLVVTLKPTAQFSITDPIPKFSLNAEVRDVDFKLKDIDVRKVGVLDGKFVEVLGDGFQEVFEQLIQNQEKRVKKKLQKELDDLQGISRKVSPEK
ncbi:hypothetical protein [Thalassoglobus polymorphus]|nr:hypothetical protein [Thalassoglobus polymorphus]